MVTIAGKMNIKECDICKGNDATFTNTVVAEKVKRGPRSRGSRQSMSLS